MSHPRTSQAPAVPAADVTRLRPLCLAQAYLDPGGPLGAWQVRNGTITLAHCVAQLESTGAVDNFRRLVGASEADYRGLLFSDSDVYKVIEAIAWEIGRTGTRDWDAFLDEVIDLIGRAQGADGYLNTWIEGTCPQRRWQDLETNHEMYCLGHLIQAAVALARCTGRTDLLEIAERFTAHVTERFGPDGTEGICGHPELETALVELYRLTGQVSHLALAQRQVDLRGHGLLRVGALGARYSQDHAPVRKASTAVGHAVRQLYLNTGVSDVYLETGEPDLLEAMRAQWRSVHEAKMYLTGAFGSRHRDEAFGDDYELPPDRAYAETCASIADFQWAWRMLLATGEAGFAEVMEREIHNAIAAAVDEEGAAFFYSNPLHLRPDRYDEENATRAREPWYRCPCCPPNLARLVASLGAYLATRTDDGVQLHLYAAGRIDLGAEHGGGHLQVRTEYPWSGVIGIDVAGPVRPGTHLGLRLPSWSTSPALRVDGEDCPVRPGPDGYLQVEISQTSYIELDLAPAPRWTRSHPRVDATRGARALEFGPLVFALEEDDLPEGLSTEDIVLDPAGDVTSLRDDEFGLRIGVEVIERHTGGGLYDSGDDEPALGESTPGARHTVPTVPFARWGNRTSRSMRVWLPLAATR